MKQCLIFFFVIMVAVSVVGAKDKKEAEAEKALPGPAKEPIFILNLDLDQPFSAAGSSLYDQGKDRLDSLANDWRKSFGTIYLCIITEKGRTIAGLTSEMKVEVFVPDYDKQKVTSALYLHMLQVRQQQLQQAQAAQARKN